LFETPTAAGLAKYIETVCWATKGIQTPSSTAKEREEVEF